MVGIRIKNPEQRAEGFILLVRQGKVRAWRGEIYVVRERSLAVLEAHNISYERLPLPLQLSEADVERDTLV